MSFLDDYEPVEDRIRAFYADHPEGRINTTLLERDGGMYIVHAAVYRQGEDVPWATGLAQEARAEKGVNATSPLENCETSAIGRALANAGYAAKGKRPSREEMSKVGGQVHPPSGTQSSDPAPQYTNEKCPKCGEGVWDNRFDATAIERNWPKFKCRDDKSCKWKTWDETFFDEKPIREDYEPAEIPESGLWDIGDPERPFD